MSINYTIDLTIGFEFQEEDFDSWLHETEDEFKFEPRWDPNTGKPAEPQRILVKNCERYYMLDGERVDGDSDGELVDDLVAAIAKKLKCDHIICGDYVSDTVTWVCFYPRGIDYLSATDKKDPLNTSWDDDRVAITGQYNLDRLAKAMPKFNRLRETLNNFGLKPGPLMARAAYHIG